MSNPRIAEVDSDSDQDMAGDPDEMDLDSFDFARPQGTLGGAARGSGPLSSSSGGAATASEPPFLPQQPQSAPQISDKERERMMAAHREKTRLYQCLYPVYFDSSRSRARGRRVAKEDAVKNPLARQLVEAVQAVGQDLGVGLQIVFEPNKCHPDDWANPGRVRVLIKEGGKAVSGKLSGKHQLYPLVAAHMKRNPTTKDDPMKLKLNGMPPMDQPPPPPAVPRGFKINEILPLHSPALSGGGVSDNMFKDMMAEMGGMGMGGGMPEALAGLTGGGAGGPAGGGAAKKAGKDKKKK